MKPTPTIFPGSLLTVDSLRSCLYRTPRQSNKQEYYEPQWNESQQRCLVLSVTEIGQTTASGEQRDPRRTSVSVEVCLLDPARLAIFYVDEVLLSG